ncbi:dihydropteroate synthase [Raineya orbicola]|jgi:dihydropteroate synthase|uniref:dihydropteroate synthase n=1 Tax=Raineya orbicola TaxID=2016530 RepID=A0A2N3IK51_9BACT|nr:dihydropteroate synthase [Raineya orbicola]PKQ70684.1 DHPS: dihydropteroate synthase [Raineya orbicola]
MNFSLESKGRLLLLDKPCIMGILNLTPDSFFEGSRQKNIDELLKNAEKMLSEGANILDIGGYSTRPGASEVSLQEELQRVIPAIEAIRRNFPDNLISVDTFRAEVAQRAIESGANIINDVSGGELDKKMFETVAHLQVPYILMHSRGNPQTMSQMCHYENILLEILHFFEQKIKKLRILGVKDIIIDVGFGFAKNINQNFFLLKNLSYFQILQVPLLVGISRKSMIYKTLSISPYEALNGTTALNMFALMQGAKILRVHDVKEAKETILLYRKLLES